MQRVMCLRLFVFKFLCSAVATPSFLCSHRRVSDFDLWNRTGAFQEGLQRTLPLCRFIFCQKKKWQMNCDHVFVCLFVVLRPNRGTELAFQLSNSLHRDAALKPWVFLFVPAKQLPCANKRLWHLVSGKSQGPRFRV